MHPTKSNSDSPPPIPIPIPIPINNIPIVFKKVVHENDPHPPRKTLVAFSAAYVILVFFVGFAADSTIWGYASLKFFSWTLPLLATCGCALHLFSLELPEKTSHYLGIALFLALFFLCHLLAFRLNNVGGSAFLTSKGHRRLLLNTRLFANERFSEMLAGHGEMLTKNDFWQWLRGPFVNNFFCDGDDVAPPTSPGHPAMCMISDGNYALPYPTRLRFHRVKAIPCNQMFNPPLVFSEAFGSCVPWYDENSAYTGTWRNPLLNVTKHCAPFVVDANGQPPQKDLAFLDNTYTRFTGQKIESRKHLGLAARYPQGGHTLNFLSHAGQKAQVRKCIDHLSEAGMLDSETAAITIDIGAFIPGTMSWHFAQVLFEFMPGGTMKSELFQQHGALVPEFPSQYIFGFPSGPLQSCLYLQEHDSSCEAQPFATENVWLVLSLAFFLGTRLVLLQFEIVWRKGIKESTFSLLLLLDWCVITILFTIFAFELVGEYHTPGIEPTPTYMPNWYASAQSLEMTRSALAILILLLWFRIFVYASNASPRFAVVGKSLLRAFSDVAVFFLLFSLLFVGFAVSFFLKYGGHHPEFRSIAVSMHSCLRGLAGDMDVAGDLFEEDPVLGYLLYAVFTFGLVFTMLTILIAIVNENFVSLSNEYQSSRKDESIAEMKRSKEGRKIADWLQKNDAPGTLRLCIWAASELASADFGYTADPYVAVSLDEGPSQKSSAVRKTLHPAWLFALEFAVAAETSPATLHFCVYDADSHSSDDLLGTASLHVDSLLPLRADKEIALTTNRVRPGLFQDRAGNSLRRKGKLKLSLSYFPKLPVNVSVPRKKTGML